MPIIIPFRAFLVLMMFGGVAYLAYAAFQPREVIFIVNETDKRAAQSWKWEFDQLYNYTELLTRNFAEKERLYTLCNGYVYPSCPENNTYTLTLEKTGSMLPEFYGGYGNVTAFKLQNYTLQVCDVISFNVSSPIPSLGNDGKVLNLTRIFHRIVGRNGLNFITKGDVNQIVDNYSPRMEDVRYVYCR